MRDSGGKLGEGEGGGSDGDNSGVMTILRE